MVNNNEHKLKRTIYASIVLMLLTAGLTLFMLNSSAAVPSSHTSDTGNVTTVDSQTLGANAAKDTLNKIDPLKRREMMIDMLAKRKAAAEKLKKSLGKKGKAAVGPATIAPAAVGIAAIAQPGPGTTPDYFGIWPNYANSPLPAVTTIGNPLIGRAIPTDNAANVFVVNTHAPLSNGTLSSFQTYNQPGSGPNTFNAYVLQPTGVPNQYTVIFDSGPLTVPSVTIGQVQTFTVTPTTVQAGDLIAHYGQGIAVDIPATPGGVGNDTLLYPAAAAPINGSIINLGDVNYPMFSTDRTYSIAVTVISGGIRKFINPLPSLTIATPTPCTYSSQPADCYEIELREYTQEMHSDLPPTKLRGYVQVMNGVDVAPISYLGPVIIATRDKPVRVKFTNKLPTGAGGDLFLPVDTTYMGAGDGPNATMSTDCSATPKPTTCYSENRATLHLHGGTTPWISDGTPHQWTTPAGEITDYPEGVSVSNVPDMPDPGAGSLTFYYTNQQSARLMFYHDHAYGITRLNVYAGEASGYLLTDQFEQDLINGTNIAGANPLNAAVLPGVGIPLVIQDKTFVPDNTTPFTNQMGTFASQLMAQDPTWNSTKWGGYGQLWYPHVYMPNQNPGDLTGANPMGRWDYGPWFWPPFTGLQFGPIPNPNFNASCVSSATQYCEGPEIPGTPDARLISPSGVPEAFMDTPLVNGKAYPVLNVPAGPVRFRILNAADDRFWNLQLYVADPNVTTVDGRKNTEVKMVPFNSNQNLITPFPTWWYTIIPGGFTFDDREGGVPDPNTRGPAMIQIGTEGGFMPAPMVVKNQPINYVYNRRDITVGNVKEKALFLGPAERADVIVDFSRFAGKTLILYSDSPAPVPAADPRLDYYTNDSDQTSSGGAPSTLAGYGPNTRTIMQIHVGAGPDSSAPVDDVNATILTALQTALPAVFNASQDTILVPQAPYNSVYNPPAPGFPGNASAYVKIQDTNFTFDPIGPTGAIRMEMEPKAIIEDFTTDYGRMNAILGNEIRHTNNVGQTSIIQAYIDPPVELINITDIGTPIGSLNDGTQIWKITHNGVDTHAIHVHLFNVQVINRVGWDGAIRPPDPNELGWKETVRMNPLEDIIVALRPLKLTNLPFKIPNSIRPMDVTRPLGSTTGFTNVDPNGNPVTPVITNQLVNFGWEYVYHCHLLGHEENDMMRPVVVSVPPAAPSNLIATGLSGPLRVDLTWTDNSVDEINFTIQRATDPGFTTGLTTFMVAGSVPNRATGGILAFNDSTVAANTSYYYQVLASNVVGILNMGAYPNNTVNSAPSNSVTVGPPAAAPSSLTAAQPNPANNAPVVVNWTDNSPNVSNPPNFNAETSFIVQRRTNGGTTWINVATLPAHPGTGPMTYTNPTTGQDGVKRRTTYTYRILATNIFGSSTSTNVAAITTR